MAVELLRWICVLPAAVLAGFAARLISGLVTRLAVDEWGIPVASGSVYYLLLIMAYVPWGAAFVIAGAMMAPRSRLATAFVLGASSSLMSLFVHVLGQTDPGVINYTHLTAESAGAAFGVAYIVYSEKARPKNAFEIGHTRDVREPSSESGSAVEHDVNR